jgi:hypothetical protein
MVRISVISLYQFSIEIKGVLQLRQCHPFVCLVGLGDVARAEDNGR